MAAVAATGEQVEYWKARAEKAEQEKRVLRMLLNAQKGKASTFVVAIIQMRSFQTDGRRFPTTANPELSNSITYRLCIFRFPHTHQDAFKEQITHVFIRSYKCKEKKCTTVMFVVLPCWHECSYLGDVRWRSLHLICILTLYHHN